MAEFVQFRLEKWTDALKLLKNLELFDQHELRTLVENISSLQYKIQSPNRKLEDVLAMINFEGRLLKEIQFRRQNLENFDKTDEIDRFIYNEIKAQFGTAEINFRHRVEFWNAKLKFISTIVPERDREKEFNTICMKALDNCGKKNFELYKDIVEFQWSFMDLPHTVNRKKRKQTRKNCSELMSSIRDVTRNALKNFTTSAVYVWVISNEFKYLDVLQQEENVQQSEPKVYFPYDILDESEKTEKLIGLFYEDFKSKFCDGSLIAYCQLYDEIEKYNCVPLANELCTTIKKLLNSQSLTSDPKILEWLGNQSLRENNIQEYMKRVEKVLSLCPSNKQIIPLFVGNLDKILDRSTSDSYAQAISFYSGIFTDENLEELDCVQYHEYKLQFLKKIPYYINNLSNTDSESLIENLRLISERYILKDAVLSCLKKFPSYFEFVKERVHFLVKKKKFNACVIHKCLAAVDWSTAKSNSDIEKFVNFVYYSHVSLSKEKGIDALMSLTRIPYIDNIRTLNLKRLYFENAESGRQFYQKFQLSVANWEFHCTAIEAETNYSSVEMSKAQSNVVAAAFERVRTGEFLVADPWIVCVNSYLKMKKEWEAFDILEMALLKLSSNEHSTMQYLRLHSFAKCVR